MTSRTRGSKKKQRQDDDEMDIDEEEDERVLFFIPSAGIDIEVLVFYLKKFLGHDSDAEPGRHPKNRDVDGYFVRSRLGLSAVMVEDLKRDSATWRDEKRQKRTRKAYAESDTADRRVESGASGRPTIPQKTQELAAKRGESLQPQGQGLNQPTNTQTAGDRRGQQDTFIQSGSYPSSFPQADATSQRHPAQYQAQQPPFSYASPTMGQPRPNPAINFNVSMSTASFSHTAPGRHQSPQSNVLPSIEDRASYNTPAPPYEEGETKRSQPSTTGTHGFSIYPTAGPKYDRHQR